MCVCVCVCVCDRLLGKWLLEKHKGVTKLSHPNLSSTLFQIMEQPKGPFSLSTQYFLKYFTQINLPLASLTSTHTQDLKHA